MKPLTAIKLLHTAVWAFFVTCIIAIPFTAALGWFNTAFTLSAFVLLECAVLLFNRMRCPMTDWAARYTPDRKPNFDIYLPHWLAEWNKEIFGTLFVLGELYTLWCWYTAN